MPSAQENSQDESAPPRKHAGGRPRGSGKYDPKYCQVAKKLFEIGGTDADLAAALCVDRRTIFNWKLEHPEFLSHCKLGMEACDDRVEASFYQRAVGYERKAVKIMSHQGESWEHEYVEEVPAEVNAGRFWLMNRRPDRWRDKQTIQHDMGDLEVLAKSLAGCVLRPKED